MMIKKMICFANSEKNSGRCIAGKTNEGWFRPVNNNPTIGLTLKQRHYYKSENDPSVLDVIKVPVLKPMPFNHQIENYIIDNQYYWEKENVIAWHNIQSLIDTPNTLWLNGESSTSGHNDRISAERISNVQGSLYLIKLQNLFVRVSKEGISFNNHNRYVRAQFEYNNITYWLKVTDPIAKIQFLSKNDTTYRIDDCYACISLAGEAFSNYYYKFVASIITKDGKMF